MKPLALEGGGCRNDDGGCLVFGLVERATARLLPPPPSCMRSKADFILLTVE